MVGLTPTVPSTIELVLTKNLKVPVGNDVAMGPVTEALRVRLPNCGPVVRESQKRPA